MLCEGGVPLCLRTATGTQRRVHLVAVVLCCVVGLRWRADVTRLRVCLSWSPARVPACVYRLTIACLCTQASRVCTQQPTVSVQGTTGRAHSRASRAHYRALEVHIVLSNCVCLMFSRNQRTVALAAVSQGPIDGRPVYRHKQELKKETSKGTRTGD